MRPLHLVIAISTVLVCAAPAGARSRGPCLPDRPRPVCHFWTLDVSDVNDGDTVGGNVRGDGRVRREVVRFSGIQTMELERHDPRRWSGECHSVKPARLVRRLIRRGGGVVRISSQDRHALQDVRLRRWVAVRRHGRWVDLGRLLVRRGLALWMGGREEHAWNRRYARAEQLADRDGRNLWDPDACGAGPAAGHPIRLWVNWSPIGRRRGHRGEWVKVRNESPDRPLRLGRWRLRDASHRSFRFPRGTVLAPGATTTVYTGRGRRSRRTFSWGAGRRIFENPSRGRRFLGGGAYLVDRDGDIRAAMHYPCLVDCGSPLWGALSLTPLPRGSNERVVVRNTSAAWLDLYGYALDVPGGMVAFDRGTVLAPGAHRVVRVPGRHRLPDRGGAVRAVTFSDVALACTAWGRGRCR